jgi:putative restriction endonuclease
MDGTVAITDFGWYESLLGQKCVEETNFWTPSAHFAFRGEKYSPFIFKLKAKYKHAVCGFGFFAQFSRLPDWLAWDAFNIRNGCETLGVMRQRIGAIRDRIDFHSDRHKSEIGCILIVQPTFFSEDAWIVGPDDWPPANLRHKRYDLTSGEGRRIWQECLARTSGKLTLKTNESAALQQQEGRYGSPQLIAPRLGQGTFRVTVTDAYQRCCAVTREHSLPALEAAHIQSYSDNGPHDIRNGILLRADLHRLFDQGYLTITTDHRLEVSPRLKADYDNGRTYYPFHGTKLGIPRAPQDHPTSGFIRWHNENKYLT